MKMTCRQCLAALVLISLTAAGVELVHAQLLPPPAPTVNVADGTFTESDRRMLRRIDLISRKLHAKFFPYQSENHLLDESP